MTTLPLNPDAIREVYCFLPFCDILRGCTVNKQIYHAIYMNIAFWLTLLRRKGVAESLLKDLSLSDLRQMSYYRDIVPRVYNLDMMHYENPTRPDFDISESPHLKCYPPVYKGYVDAYELRETICDAYKSQCRDGVYGNKVSFEVYHDRFRELMRNLCDFDILYINGMAHLVEQMHRRRTVRRFNRRDSVTLDSDTLAEALYIRNGRKPLTYDAVNSFFVNTGITFTEFTVRRTSSFSSIVSKLTDETKPVGEVNGIMYHRNKSV